MNSAVENAAAGFSASAALVLPMPSQAQFLALHHLLAHTLLRVSVPFSSYTSIRLAESSKIFLCSLSTGFAGSHHFYASETVLADASLLCR